MLDHLFHESGGSDVKGADLLFTDEHEQIPVGIDVKTFDCRDRKRYFAINNNKHKELAGQCVGYMGLVCPPYARAACVTRLIPYDSVSLWKVWQLRKDKDGKKRGTPSRNLLIEVAMQEYAGVAYDIESSRLDAYSEDAVHDLASRKGNGTVISRLSRLLPLAAPFLAEAQSTL
jgi:hypothetical protein